MADKSERQQYAEEVAKAQEEADKAQFEPVSDTITQSEWDMRNLRRSVEDGNWLFDVVNAHGSPNVVPDPKPEEEAAEEKTTKAEAK
jgi:hypothetical protein